MNFVTFIFSLIKNRNKYTEYLIYLKYININLYIYVYKYKFI